jgi:hypothetical protein
LPFLQLDKQWEKLIMLTKPTFTKKVSLLVHTHQTKDYQEKLYHQELKMIQEAQSNMFQ